MLNFILIHTFSLETSYPFQKYFAIISPLPYRDNALDVDNFNISQDMDSVMFGRPELMFKVKLKPYGEVRDESIELPLIFFSAFERVALESDDKMHRMGNIIQLYEPGPLPALEPIMHVGALSHVLCRVPLIPCFMDGSDQPTIPRRFARSTKINHGRADRKPGTGDDNKLYE